MTAPTTELLTVREAAAILRTSRYTIYRRIAAGQLEYVDGGGHLKISRKSLDAYIERNTKTAGEQR